MQQTKIKKNIQSHILVATDPTIKIDINNNIYSPLRIPYIKEQYKYPSSQTSTTYTIITQKMRTEIINDQSLAVPTPT